MHIYVEGTARTFSVFDKLTIWPLCVAVIFIILKQIVQIAFLLTWDRNLQPTWTNVSNATLIYLGQQVCESILKFMHKCRSKGLDKLNLRPFDHLTLKCNLELQPPWTNNKNGSFTH